MSLFLYSFPIDMFPIFVLFGIFLLCSMYIPFYPYLPFLLSFSLPFSCFCFLFLSFISLQFVSLYISYVDIHKILSCDFVTFYWLLDDHNCKRYCHGLKSVTGRRGGDCLRGEGSSRGNIVTVFQVFRYRRNHRTVMSPQRYACPLICCCLFHI
jgi:hypothetical protein